ncbi:hypothetical protein [Geodermatophilus sp. URMC 63]
MTTAALALTLAWPHAAVLAGLDPAGGDVLAGYGRARLSAGGLAELQLDTMRRARLPGLSDATAARHVYWERLATVLASLEDKAVDVLADCGGCGPSTSRPRWSAGRPPWWW